MDRLPDDLPSNPITEQYAILDPENIEIIKVLKGKLAQKLNKPIKITHVNSTKYGGGVAEILKSLVPLANSFGLNVSWNGILGSEEFFTITKSIHNGLQGMNLELTQEMLDVYLQNITNVAEGFTFDSDVVIVHDPQPLALINWRNNGNAKWIWRCHIDLTSPNQVFIDWIKNYIEKYDATIFSSKSYTKNINNQNIFTVFPCIDPFSDKNKELPQDLINEIVRRFGIDPEKPIITQVARFDPWKDPFGAVELYRLLKKKFSDLQLVLIGSMATDDPQGKEWYNGLVGYTGNDRDIHILTDLEDAEVNAFQCASDVIMQMSTREGFGLGVTEALWKEKPVVARRVGGITYQVIDNSTGFLFDSLEEAEEKVEYLLTNSEEARRIGKNGKEHVRKNFLITRLLREELEIINKIF